MRFRALLCTAMAALLVAAAAATAATAAPPSSSTVVTAPVTGTFTDALGGTGTFVGTYTLERFTTQNGQLAVVGTLTGTLTDSLGAVIGTITTRVTALIDTNATCQILELTLGPLDLDLLGLQVHLDQVHLEITAQSGPGNLLGNLLCGIAGLLDTGAPASAIVRLLNELLNLLG
jgi:hypothetical protein